MGETSALLYLRAALATVSGELKVKIALAIKELSSENDSSELMKEIILVLNSQILHHSVKIKAVIGLRDFKSRESEAVLLRAVARNEEYLVQYYSCESLLIR